MSVYDIFPVKEVSGDIVTFEDGADGIPMESLSAVIELTQDLHGYDHPWPAGSGKNKIDKSAGLISSSRFMAFGVESFSDTIPDGSLTLPAGDYTFSLSGDNSTNAESMAVFGADGTRIKIVYNNKILSFTNPAEQALKLTVTISSGNFTTWDNYDMQLEAGSAPTAWVPYANICPISGLTGLSVYVSPTQDPDDATVYNVDWTTQAGTVCHGTVDPVAGQLTVDWIYKEFNGTEAWNAIATYCSLWGQLPSKSNTDMSQKSNIFVAGGNGYAEYNKFRVQENGAIVVGNKKEDGTTGWRWANAAAFKSFLADLYSAGTPFAVCYELATPLTYQLTPQEIATLLGLNNVWATVAPITVEYHAQAQTENVRIDKLFVNGEDMQGSGWFLKWRKLAAPKPKTDYISVWGRDGDIDLTENESDGQVFYENRELTMDMVYIGDNWTQVYSELLDKLHGKDCMVQFTSDPYWYWTGRVVASLFEHKPHSLTMNGIMFPYKLSVSKNTASATVNGATEETATEVVLQGSRMRVSPKVTVTGESITLKWGNKTQTLSAGTYYVRGLKVSSEDVTIKVWGTGTVNFEYRKGML